MNSTFNICLFIYFISCLSEITLLTILIYFSLTRRNILLCNTSKMVIYDLCIFLLSVEIAFILISFIFSSSLVILYHKTYNYNERELTTLIVCIYLQLAEELTREYGVPEDASAKITATYLKQFRKCPDNTTLTLDAWRTILWSKALGHKYSHLAKKIYERWLYLRYHYMMLAPNTVSMLRQFRKKYLLGLITNGPSNAQWEKIHKLSLEQYFDIILVSGDLPWEKPEAEIFQKACHFLNVTPEKCIMVGDKLETDILGGIEAGLYGTVWIPTTDKARLSGDDPKPDFIIRHVTELLRILERGPNAPELEDCSSNGSDGS